MVSSKTYRLPATMLGLSFALGAALLGAPAPVAARSWPPIAESPTPAVVAERVRDSAPPR